MPELRRDPVAGRWVIIASERARRPDDFAQESVPAPRNVPCAFCAGNESMTPSEIMSVRSHGTWKSRVVANKFPALMVEGGLEKRGEGMYDFMNGVGAHEVIIESPRHEVSITALSDAEVRDVLWLYKQRLLDLRNDLGLIAEEWDPETRRQLGNFPQAFTHVALVNTAFNLSAHDGRSIDQRAPDEKPTEAY